MKIGKMIPPAAAPVSAREIWYGICRMLDDRAIPKFERELREYFGSKHVFTVSSGKAALTLILQALNGISGREKVLIPAYTCYSVPSAVVNAGLRIVLCDLDPDTLDYDFDKLKKLVHDDILCILSTHLFGIPSDVERIREMTANMGIFLVEDAAQAMGAVHEGKMLGTVGDAGFFSLGRGKNITCGSGGIILTSSDRIAQEIGRSYANVGSEPAFRDLKNILEVCLMSLFLNRYLYWIPRGLPFLQIGETQFFHSFPVNRLSRFRAGLLHKWHAKMDRFNSARKEISDHYLHSLGLKDVAAMYSGGFPYLRFPVYGSSEEDIHMIARRHGDLGISPMYPSSVNKIKEIQNQFEGEQYEIAEWIAKKLVTLPTHVLVRSQDRSHICEIFHKSIKTDKDGGKQGHLLQESQ